MDVVPNLDGNSLPVSSDEEPTIGQRKRSVDSRYLTKRTVLHHKKSEIIPDINKALRIKRGAENLLQANEQAKISNKSNRVQIEGVLDTESAALGTLKDKMDFLNSDFRTYQNLESRLPMIPVGLKDTDSIDFEEALSPFISSHYHDDPTNFNDALKRLTQCREKLLEPRRSLDGLRDFRRYYDFLNTIERRFFDDSVRHGFRFSWSDAFTGERHSQRSPAFEKGALIFNYAALCSQIAAENSEQTAEALAEQMKMFMQSRANFQVLQESFAHAPSRDMATDVLGFLIRIMQAQAQEALFLKDLLEDDSESDFVRLANYIGGASFMSERFGKLASPMASGGLGGGSEEWTQVESVVPSSWVRLLEVKSQFYQAQVNHRLAHTLIYLALHGKPPPESSEDQEPLGPLPVEGLYSDDGFLESQVSSHLGNLFSVLKPYIQLHKQAPREKRRRGKTGGGGGGGGGRRLHRNRSAMAMTGGAGEGGSEPRSQSRLRRTLSSLSIGNWGRSKSQAGGLNDDASSVVLNGGSASGGRFSSLSSRSAVSTASAPNLYAGDMNGGGGGGDGSGLAVPPPTTRKEAHLLGQVCLAEAIAWARQALQTIEQSTDLNRESEVKDFINRHVAKWSEELARVTRTPNCSIINGTALNAPPQAPTAKPRRRWLSRSKSFNRQQPPPADGDNISVISGASITSTGTTRSHHRGKSIEKAALENLWTAPTFLPVEVELPKDNSTVLKTGRNMLSESRDPFRMLGPMKFFNARKCWTEAYTVQLERNQEVAYGFSIQGTGPVEILGVDANTPASERGLRTSDLVVGINGLDARFMTHNEAVAAIRFGAEGFDAALKGGDADGVMPAELDVVELTLIRPASLPQRRPSTTSVAGSTTAPIDVSGSASLSNGNSKVRKHNSMRSSQPSTPSLFRKKSNVSTASSSLFQPEDWFFGLSTKLRKHNSTISHRDVFSKYRTSPYT